MRKAGIEGRIRHHRVYYFNAGIWFHLIDQSTDRELYNILRLAHWKSLKAWGTEFRSPRSYRIGESFGNREERIVRMKCGTTVEETSRVRYHHRSISIIPAMFQSSRGQRESSLVLERRRTSCRDGLQARRPNSMAELFKSWILPRATHQSTTSWPPTVEVTANCICWIFLVMRSAISMLLLLQGRTARRLLFFLSRCVGTVRTVPPKSDPLATHMSHCRRLSSRLPCQSHALHALLATSSPPCSTRARTLTSFGTPRLNTKRTRSAPQSTTWPLSFLFMNTTAQFNMCWVCPCLELEERGQ